MMADLGGRTPIKRAAVGSRISSPQVEARARRAFSTGARRFVGRSRSRLYAGGRHRPAKYSEVCGRQYSKSSARLRMTFMTAVGSLIEAASLKPAKFSSPLMSARYFRRRSHPRISAIAWKLAMWSVGLAAEPYTPLPLSCFPSLGFWYRVGNGHEQAPGRCHALRVVGHS